MESVCRWEVYGSDFNSLMDIAPCVKGVVEITDDPLLGVTNVYFSSDEAAMLFMALYMNKADFIAQSGAPDRLEDWTDDNWTLFKIAHA